VCFISKNWWCYDDEDQNDITAAVLPQSAVNDRFSWSIRTNTRDSVHGEITERIHQMCNCRIPTRIEAQCRLRFLRYVNVDLLMKSSERGKICVRLLRHHVFSEVFQRVSERTSLFNAVRLIFCLFQNYSRNRSHLNNVIIFNNAPYSHTDFDDRGTDYFISFIPVLQDTDDDRAGAQSVTRQQIKTATGQINYNKHMDKQSHEHDVKICVEVKNRSNRKTPVLFSLKFVEISEDFKMAFPDMQFNGEGPKLSQAGGADIGKDQTLAKEHLTFLEKSIFNMVRETDLLIGSADVSKEEDAVFSKKSMDMYSAAKWWPIMHLAVLFVTGYTQANHVVSFFKSRHII